MFKYFITVLDAEGLEYEPGSVFSVTLKSVHSTIEESKEAYERENPGMEVKSIKFIHGGKRLGAGKPRRWANPSKPAKIPASVTDTQEFFNDAAFLVHILKEYRENLHPTSPRSEKLRELMGILEDNDLLKRLGQHLADVD